MLQITAGFNITCNVIIFLLIFQLYIKSNYAVDTSYHTNIISNEVAGRICYHSVCLKSILRNEESSLVRLNSKLNDKIKKTLNIVAFGDSVMDGK